MFLTVNDKVSRQESSQIKSTARDLCILLLREARSRSWNYLRICMFREITYDVVEGNVHSHETKEFRNAEEHPRNVAQDLKIEERPLRGGEGLCPHDGNRDQERAEHNESQDSGRPAEPNLRFQLMKDDWIDDSSCVLSMR